MTSQSKKPIFVDPRLRRVFERQIWRPLVAPELWKGHRMQRVFLHYGQKGAGMEEAVLQLLDERPEVTFKALLVTKDAAEMKEAFATLKKDSKFTHLLIIRKGHLLKYHRELFLTTHDLKHLPNSVGFILVLSEEIPNDEESQFWEQFPPGQRIPTALPTKDFYKKLLEWYFSEWKKSESPAALGTELGQLDLDELAICCAYSTQSDVKRFVRWIIDYIIDQYPDSKQVPTMEFLKERGFLFPFAGTSIMSISSKDGHMVQMRYDPQGITEAPSIAAAASESEPKKLKFTMDGEEKQIPT